VRPNEKTKSIHKFIHPSIHPSILKVFKDKGRERHVNEVNEPLKETKKNPNNSVP
jgi:hypothetical protein